MASQRFGNFNRAENGRFQTAKDERTAVPGWQPQEFSLGVGRAKLLGVGIADDVDEKHVGDFQSQFRFLIVSHVAYGTISFSISGSSQNANSPGINEKKPLPTICAIRVIAVAARPDQYAIKPREESRAVRNPHAVGLVNCRLRCG